MVNLVASPAAGWGFNKWTGDASGETLGTSVFVDRPRTATAVFAQVDLNVTKTGEGTVTATPPGGAQTPPFTETYGIHSSVAAAASPRTNWFFDHWNGDVPPAINGDQSISLDMDQDRSVEAVFTECEADITLMAIRFTDTADVRAYPAGTLLNNGYHYSLHNSNTGPIAPVRYGIGGKPTMDIELWVQSSDCTELLIRAKAGSTELGQKSMSIGMPPRLIAVNGLGGTIQIPGHDVLGAPTTTIAFDYSTDGGSSWHAIGSGGPSKWYTMLDTDVHGEVPYDLAFDKVVEYAAGLSDTGGVAAAIMSGVDARLVFNAEANPAIVQHILELYGMPSNVKAACNYHAPLMEYLCSVSGMDAEHIYVFGGVTFLEINRYQYNGLLGLEWVSIQVEAAPKDDEPENPHYLFHMQVVVDGVFYDPSYGTTGLLTDLEVAVPYSGNGVVPPVTGSTVYVPDKQFKYGNFPGMGPIVQWTCPH